MQMALYSLTLHAELMQNHHAWVWPDGLAWCAARVERVAICSFKSPGLTWLSHNYGPLMPNHLQSTVSECTAQRHSQSMAYLYNVFPSAVTHTHTAIWFIMYISHCNMHPKKLKMNLIVTFECLAWNIVTLWRDLNWTGTANGIKFVSNRQPKPCMHINVSFLMLLFFEVFFFPFTSEEIYIRDNIYMCVLAYPETHTHILGHTWLHGHTQTQGHTCMNTHTHGHTLTHRVRWWQHACMRF